jgi:hypothetical protein
MKKTRKISEAIAVDIEGFCDDPNAQTAREIRDYLRSLGKPNGDTIVMDWLNNQITAGRVKRVKVKRTNTDGTIRAVTAYLMVE